MVKYSLREEGGMFRLVAEMDFSGVKKGDLGGLVSGPDNLSQDGKAWVLVSARVYGNAQVSKSPLLISGLNWRIFISDSHLTIGCQQHALKAWADFSEEDINDMSEYAREFWARYKDHIMALAKTHQEETK